MVIVGIGELEVVVWLNKIVYYYWVKFVFVEIYSECLVYWVEVGLDFFLMFFEFEVCGFN